MQETCNNCFSSKKCNTILPQAKANKHDYRKITAAYKKYALVTYSYFRQAKTVKNKCLKIITAYKNMNTI